MFAVGRYIRKHRLAFVLSCLYRLIKYSIIKQAREPGANYLLIREQCGRKERSNYVFTVRIDSNNTIRLTSALRWLRFRSVATAY